jgi:hypothetical protein
MDSAILPYKEMALMISRRLRAAHDSIKSLAVDPVEAR